MNTVYLSYLIRHNALNGRIWIEKGQHFIAWADSVEDARRIIDELVKG